MAERRKSGRSRVLKSAKLVLGRSAIIDCVVRNLTNKGARLQIANTVDLPRDFAMTLDGGYSIRPCRLVWRTVTETGVAGCLIKPRGAQATPSDQTATAEDRRIQRQSCGERSRLKRELRGRIAGR